MFSQFFGNFLVQSGKMTDAQFTDCVDYINKNHVKLGLIAENEGLLTRQQADELNQLQRQSDKRFGDLAVENGYLTEADVDYLLSCQGNPYLIFIQALEENQILSRAEIDQSVLDFQSAYQLSDAELKAIQAGDIEAMLPAYIDSRHNRYLPLIGLTLRSLVRFVSSNIRIEKGAIVTSHAAQYIAYQHTTGDYDGFLGFTCDGDGILTLADAFAGEKFSSVDEDALDAVCELTNCINGLYATELSYQDTAIDMLPPEFFFDGTIKDEEGFMVLPIYVDRQKLSLVIKV